MFPPIVMSAVQAWNFFSVLGLHPVLKLLACCAGIAAAVYAILLMYRHLPVFVSTGLTITCMTALYWWAAREFGADPIWSAAVGVGAGLIGFFGGRTFARDERHLHADNRSSTNA
jgi:hypothetical protein